MTRMIAARMSRVARRLNAGWDTAVASARAPKRTAPNRVIAVSIIRGGKALPDAPDQSAMGRLARKEFGWSGDASRIRLSKKRTEKIGRAMPKTPMSVTCFRVCDGLA